MLNLLFVGAIATLLFALLCWGFKTLPQERWQMIAAVPTAKNPDGHWNGVNLTFYGFFSATGITCGIALATLLVLSTEITPKLWLCVAAATIGFCLPASRIIAGLVERKANTFSIAAAAFPAAILLPPLLWLGEKTLRSYNVRLDTAPLIASILISYAIAEAIGRLACISFGCCYGMPLQQARPWLAKLFKHHNLVLHGSTKKAAYASGLRDQPLIPVQALTSIVFACSGLIGLIFFLNQQWRLAMIVPAIGTWGWRAIAEGLRADHRGNSRLSAYQIMSLVATVYLTVFAWLVPIEGSAPNLKLGLHYVASAGMFLSLEALWVCLFLYYGRSRVTASSVSFHVVQRSI
jgi:hypothetical protein